MTARHGLLIAYLIAAGVALLFLAFAPAPPAADDVTGRIAVHVVQPAPHVHPEYANEEIPA